MKDVEKNHYLTTTTMCNGKWSNIAIIAQARCGSTRLPAKVLKPFKGDKCLLDILIEKFKKIKNIQVVIATSINKGDDPVEEICRKHSVICFRGSENDVLERFISAAEQYGCNKIIRVCSDNPFLEVNALNELVEYSRSDNKFDYIGFKVGDKPSILTHYGFWAEYVTLEALKKVKIYADEPLYREHVTNYIYSHRDKFKIDWLSTSPRLLDRNRLRLTIDTESDFRISKQIYDEITLENSCTTIEDIITYLDNNPNYYELMQIEIANNSK